MEDTEFNKNLKKAITAAERKKQKLFLKSVEASLDKSIEKPKKINWLVAASIVAIIGLSVYFIVDNQSLSNQELYAENFTPYENVIVPIVRNNLNLTKKAQAFAFYELGEYQKAIAQFNKLTNTDTTDVATINFYKANAYLSIKNYKKSKDLLQQIVDNNNQKWQQESLWYLALISLKLEKTDIAKLHLLKLQQQKSFKIDEVKVLLNNLN
ncbi:MAG: tol-pal system YbgF family protein [Polaribacter sp.]